MRHFFDLLFVGYLTTGVFGVSVLGAIVCAARPAR